VAAPSGEELASKKSSQIALRPNSYTQLKNRRNHEEKKQRCFYLGAWRITGASWLSVCPGKPTKGRDI
jgi:hypothetical protein